MNQADCLALRDMLFECRFNTGEYKGRVYRYLAVVPDGVGDSAATVHYAFAPAIWELAGCFEDPDSYLEKLIGQTPYKDANLALQFHDYQQHGWSLSWEITATDSTMPLLVVQEAPDGKIVGALMRDPHTQGNIAAAIAEQYAEPEEVAEVLQKLDSLAAYEKFMGLYKEGAIHADSLADAIANTSMSEGKQKEVLLYRGMEWWSGLWNQGQEGDIRFSSVADFFGCRVSEAKRQQRGDLAVVRAKANMQADYAPLIEAVKHLPLDELVNAENYESLSSVRLLCDWWNTRAEEGGKLAGYFRLYVWDDEKLIFHACDPEEPAVTAADMADAGCFALFEEEGRPAVAAIFYRGRAYNDVDESGWVQLYLANGELGYNIGTELWNVNEAYYSFVGLRAIRDQYLAAEGTPHPGSLYRKFHVHRVDMRDAPGGDRFGAEYFVLDATYDPFAKSALTAYAKACEKDLPQLAEDLVTHFGLGPDEDQPGCEVPEYEETDTDLAPLEGDGRRTYRITHYYNIGDQDVYVEHPTGEVDGMRVALYCWYKANEWFGPGAILSDLGTASLMVAFYGFRHCAATPCSTTVDLYADSNGIGAEKYQELMSDPTLFREGLREAMAPHIEGAENPVATRQAQPVGVRCDLPPAGMPKAPEAVREWVERACAAVREAFTGDATVPPSGNVTAKLWPYRVGNTEHLSCDFFDEMGSASWALTVTAAGVLDVAGPVEEPKVSDLADALHLAALLIAALGATASFKCETKFAA